ncbi:MAG: hypothetical protein ACF8PG_06355 [Maioricimonas sp. JB045]|uniref:hypothetical protein n=1 Tax=Maioricimonas sp. JC845 TaxID=3232138 RepID=UPI00345A68C9
MSVQTEAQQSDVFRAAIPRHWPDFTEPELDWIDGRINRLYLAISQKYGISRDEAARHVWRFVRQVESGTVETEQTEEAIV